MRPGTNHIFWGFGSLIVCGATIVLARRLYQSGPVYDSGNEIAFWMFLAASVVVGCTGAFMLLVGSRERLQFGRARASIPGAPDHRPESNGELAVRVLATLAATDGDLNDVKAGTLRRLFSRMDGNPMAAEPVEGLFPKAVSSDIASEILVMEEGLDPAARDFILNCCYLLIDALDDPGPVQDELMVRIAAAMGMSELGLTAHLDRFERSTAPLPRFGASSDKA
jgi:hypothetical protein